MTDYNPLAPIEALADMWACDDPGCDREGGDVIRAELAEARLAVDALVVERDGWRRQLQELQSESRILPCDGACTDYAEEDCSRHGREPADLWRIIDEIRAERDAAREALARVEALVDEPAHSPGQCCGGYCLTGLHDLDRDTLASFREVIRTALAQPATRHELARVIWETSRGDEGTISATGANIVADAILAAGWRRR